jgi:hypothetical protein
MRHLPFCFFANLMKLSFQRFGALCGAVWHCISAHYTNIKSSIIFLISISINNSPIEIIKIIDQYWYVILHKLEEDILTALSYTMSRMM